MNANDVLLDVIQHFYFSLHRVLKDTPDEAMRWQPDPEANNIAVTTWHVCRAIDLLNVKLLQNRPDSEQLWYAKGWAARTGYDPVGLGFGGFGNLSGYTLEQVKEVPQLSAGELLEYFDQVVEALCDTLPSMTAEMLDQPPPGWPDVVRDYQPETAYIVIIMFLMDNREHLGEIKAIKAMWNRKFQKAT